GPDSPSRAFLAEIETPIISATTPQTVRLNTDRAVIEAAKARGLPVFAEDRRILQVAEEAGLSAYPFGILCALPILRGLWSVEEAQARYAHFALTRPYRKDLDAFCQDMFLHLKTIGY